MPSRRIEVSVECCDPGTGDMQLTVEDPGNPEPDWQYQDMVLHPAVCHLLHELLGHYVVDEISTMQSITLNAQEG